MQQIEYACQDCEKHLTVHLITCPSCKSRNVNNVTLKKMEEDLDHVLGKWKSMAFERGEEIEKLKKQVKDLKEQVYDYKVAYENTKAAHDRTIEKMRRNQ